MREPGRLPAAVADAVRICACRACVLYTICESENGVEIGVKHQANATNAWRRLCSQTKPNVVEKGRGCVFGCCSVWLVLADDTNNMNITTSRLALSARRWARIPLGPRRAEVAPYEKRHTRASTPPPVFRIRRRRCCVFYECMYKYVRYIRNTNHHAQ